MWFPHIAIDLVFVLDMVTLYFLAMMFSWCAITITTTIIIIIIIVAVVVVVVVDTENKLLLLVKF